MFLYYFYYYFFVMVLIMSSWTTAPCRGISLKTFPEFNTLQMDLDTVTPIDEHQQQQQQQENPMILKKSTVPANSIHNITDEEILEIFKRPKLLTTTTNFDDYDDDDDDGDDDNIDVDTTNNSSDDHGVDTNQLLQPSPPPPPSSLPSTTTIDAEIQQDFSDSLMGESFSLNRDNSVFQMQNMLQGLNPHFDLDGQRSSADVKIVSNSFSFQSFMCQIRLTELCHEFDIFCKQSHTGDKMIRQRCYSNPTIDSQLCKEALKYKSCALQVVSETGKNTQELFNVLKKLLGYSE